jgi:hypothetical protein
MGKATWGSVWIQLIIWAVISGTLVAAGRLLSPLPVLTPAQAGNLSPETLQSIVAINTYSGVSMRTLIGIPLGFFISMGILYVIAKAFNGQGTFLAQSYTSVLFQVPLGILGSTLALIPSVELVSLAVAIYGIVLQVYAIMASHRLSGGKAAAVVFLPALVVTTLLVALVVIFLSVFLIMFGLSQ